MKNIKVNIFIASCAAFVLVAFGIFALFFWGIQTGAKIKVNYYVNNCGPITISEYQEEDFGVYETKKYRNPHKFEDVKYDAGDAKNNTGWFIFENDKVIKCDSNTLIESSTSVFALYGSDEEILEYMSKFSIFVDKYLGSAVLVDTKKVSETESISTPYLAINQASGINAISFDVYGTLNGQIYTACVQILNIKDEYKTVRITYKNIENPTYLFGNDACIGKNETYSNYYVKTVYTALLDDYTIPADFNDAICNRVCEIVEDTLKDLHNNLCNVWWTKDFLN